MSQSENQNVNQKSTAWVEPLVKLIVSAAPIGPATPINCPMCDCDHQQYQGSGVLSPSKKDGKLVCSFPTSETMVKIDLPDLPIRGVTQYVRYRCLHGGHEWAVITAFHDDKTIVWCAEFTPMNQLTTCQSKNNLSLPQPEIEDTDEVLPVAPAVAQPGKSPVQDVLTQLGFNTGTPPLIVISPALLKEMNPAAYDQLKTQLGGLGKTPAAPAPLKPKTPIGSKLKKVTSPTKIQVDGEAIAVGHDHESPLAMLPPKMNLRFQSWLAEDRVDADGILPVIPPKLKTQKKAPHRVVGAFDTKALNAMSEWLFMLSVELRSNMGAIHGLVYWHTTLLIVVDDGTDKSLFKLVTDAIIGLNTLKPTNVILISRSNYEELRQFKEIKANEDKS